MNLAPHSAGSGFGLALSGSDFSGIYDTPNIKVSWWVANVGSRIISDTFTVEVRFDGVALAQWQVNRLARNSFVFVEDFEGLFDGIPVTEGVHTVELVMDATNAIHETNEVDNVLTQSITMTAVEIPEVSPELRPNLTPAPFRGKLEPLFASSHPDDPLAGKLSVDHPSYVAIGAANRSVHYILGNVDVDIYFDEILARRLVWSDIGADTLVQFDLDDLHDLVDISPGTHTMRVVVDPLNRVSESDETDNEYEVELVWGVGDPLPSETPFVLEPPEREPTLAANLMPFRPFGWDAAITAEPMRSTNPTGQDRWLEAAKAVRIDFAFTNASRFSLPLTDQLTADVLIDGVLVERRNFDTGSSNVGTTWTDSVVVLGGQIAPGEHTVRVVLDADNLFEEISEDDNIFERTFTWNDGPDLTVPEPFSMSDEEISAALAPVFNEFRWEVRPVLGPGAGEKDWTEEIAAAGRAVYFLLTGRDVDEEGYVIHFLPHDEFRSSSTAACMTRWITMSTSEYEERFDFCTEEGNEIGFKTRSNGQIHLFVDLGLSPLDALGTYLHELGHGLQDRTSPRQTDAWTAFGARGLFEAQAQIFEAAGWRAIEEFMDQSLSQFPLVDPAVDRFDFLFDLRLERDTVHDLGYRMLWVQALTPDEDLNVADELHAEGTLSSKSAMELFNYLLDIRASQISSWATDVLARTDLMEEFREIAMSRFIEDLPLEMTGHTAVQNSAWQAP